MIAGTHKVLMLRPSHFGFNPETAASNIFQKQAPAASGDSERQFEALVSLLKANEVDTRVFNQAVNCSSPDAVFLNNWFAMIPGGQFILFPMMSASRRSEYHEEIIRYCQCNGSALTMDWRHYAEKGLFLEGTGSIVFDHVHRLAYACRSPRTNERLLDKLCAQIGYRPVVFSAYLDNVPIYHTNVILSVGTGFAVLASSLLKNTTGISGMLRKSGHEVINISAAQLRSFCGNIIELRNKAGEMLILMSGRAEHGFQPHQLNALSKYGKIIHCDVSAFEQRGGGGVRCMVARVYHPHQAV